MIYLYIFDSTVLFSQCSDFQTDTSVLWGFKKIIIILDLFCKTGVIL